MDKQALKPNFYTDFTSKVNKIVEEEPLTGDQQALAYITHFKGWELLKDKKAKLEEYLENSLANAIANNASMKEIGERALVKELAKYVLNEFVSKADNARRAEDKK